MPGFYTWAILLINQQDEIGINQLSFFGSRGGQNSPLMQVPLCMLSCPQLNFFQSQFFRNFFSNTMRVTNSLDPDQARQRLSADDTSKQRVKSILVLKMCYLIYIQNTK